MTSAHQATVMIDTNGDIVVNADANGVIVALGGISFR
jgi:hypothetical protein